MKEKMREAACPQVASFFILVYNKSVIGTAFQALSDRDYKGNARYQTEGRANVSFLI